jgi:hypothetical protein
MDKPNEIKGFSEIIIDYLLATALETRLLCFESHPF